MRPFIQLSAAVTSVFAVALFLGLSASAVGAEPTCEPTGSPCEVALGDYHIALPDNRPAGPLPVVLHFHGAGGTGAGVIGNKGMINPILDRGYALIAPNGLGREGRRGGFWSFIPGRPIRRDELAFTRQVLDDAVARFGLDRDRVLLTGFSIGGSLTWYLACQAPNDFTAYAPVAGGFWRPHPTDCAGPIKMLHTHGWRDSTVPLEGRPIRGGEIHQGDIFQGLQLWRAKNGCNAGRRTISTSRGGSGGGPGHPAIPARRCRWRCMPAPTACPRDGRPSPSIGLKRSCPRGASRTDRRLRVYRKPDIQAPSRLADLFRPTDGLSSAPGLSSGMGVGR